MALSSGTDPVVEQLTVGGVTVTVGDTAAAAPTATAPKGSLFINTGGSSTTARLFINTGGSTVWTSIPTTA